MVKGAMHGKGGHGWQRGAFLPKGDMNGGGVTSKGSHQKKGSHFNSQFSVQQKLAGLLKEAAIQHGNVDFDTVTEILKIQTEVRKIPL